MPLTPVNARAIGPWSNRQGRGRRIYSGIVSSAKPHRGAPMNSNRRTVTLERRRADILWLAVIGSFLALVFALNALAQAPAASGGAAAEFTPEELEKLVAPIALYPD